MPASSEATKSGTKLDNLIILEIKEASQAEVWLCWPNWRKFRNPGMLQVSPGQTLKFSPGVNDIIPVYKQILCHFSSPDLWRRASYIKIEPATPAFRDPPRPSMGSLTTRSQCSRTSLPRPLCSPPITRTSGPRKSTL